MIIGFWLVGWLEHLRPLLSPANEGEAGKQLARNDDPSLDAPSRHDLLGVAFGHGVGGKLYPDFLGAAIVVRNVDIIAWPHGGIPRARCCCRGVIHTGNKLGRER